MQQISMYMYDLSAESLAYLCQFEQPLQYVQHNVPGDELKVLAVLTDQSLYVQHHLVGHDKAVGVQHLLNKDFYHVSKKEYMYFIFCLKLDSSPTF